MWSRTSRSTPAGSEIKDLARKDGAVLAATDWTVNGSVREGRKMVRDFSKLGALARPAITAHPDETLRTIANRMAAHHITRVVIVARGDAGGVEGILSLRHLLEVRRVDLHEEQHAERLVTPFLRTPRASRTVATGTGELQPQEGQLTP
ncbi:CBS domain-containing protein [Streptomyces sp. NPDC006703]|uniref:CBS domain-containing protein n=1 Tax=Streptomyces sp. NPDC006703 TaxID=3364759 RepID=UPI0036753D71